MLVKQLLLVFKALFLSLLCFHCIIKLISLVLEAVQLVPTLLQLNLDSLQVLLEILFFLLLALLHLRCLFNLLTLRETVVLESAVAFIILIELYFSNVSYTFGLLHLSRRDFLLLPKCLLLYRQGIQFSSQLSGLVRPLCYHVTQLYYLILSLGYGIPLCAYSLLHLFVVFMLPL